MCRSYFKRKPGGGIGEAAAHETLCGSPMWAAPEVIRGEPYTSSCDVYSYGVVLVELLTKKKPYHAQLDAAVGPLALMMRVAKEGLRPKMPDWTVSAVRELVTACLSGDPDQRPTMPQVLERLQARDVVEFDSHSTWLLTKKFVRSRSSASSVHTASSKSSKSSSFKVGTRVQAKREGSIEFMLGKVMHANDNGTYFIKFEDGEIDKAVPEQNIKARILGAGSKPAPAAGGGRGSDDGQRNPFATGGGNPYATGGQQKAPSSSNPYATGAKASSVGTSNPYANSQPQPGSNPYATAIATATGTATGTAPSKIANPYATSHPSPGGNPHAMQSGVAQTAEAGQTEMAISSAFDAPIVSGPAISSFSSEILAESELKL